MPIVTKSILKGYFETGDRPTESEFIDLIDSIVILGTGSATNVGDINLQGDITAGSGSFSYLSASGNVVGLTGSFEHLEGDGGSLTNVKIDNPTHGNKVSLTGSLTVEENSNQTLATNNTGEYTVPLGATYTVSQGSQIDLQYTPLAERLYRYNVDTGTFKAYAQANIDSETTLIKGFGAGTAGVGNDSTVRHNATVPENFVAILHTTTNVTQSEDPNNNPMTTDPHSITIQDQSTYTVKQGADVTVDGVHHGVVRKDIALFKTMGIGDTQAIGPSGSDSFNDQYNNIYPSASAHLHISSSNPVVKIEAASGTGLLSIDGNISASGQVSASGFDTKITTAASADAYSYSVNGRKVEVRNQLQAQLNDGTFTHLELRNTSIETNSIVLGSFTGNTSGNITGSIITAATTAQYTASVQIHNETSENVANDTAYTASFIVL